MALTVVVLLVGLFVALVIADAYSVRKNQRASDELRRRFPTNCGTKLP